MQVYKMGRRLNWKDDEDLYYSLKEHFTIKKITDRTSERYGLLFFEFFAQLGYFNDNDYPEPVEFLVIPVPDMNPKLF